MRIHHLGVAVRSLLEAGAFYRDALGLDLQGVEEVPSEGVKVAFLPAGEPRIELLEPLFPDSPVGRFLEKRGEGIHHVCFEVAEIDAAVARLRSGGAEILEPAIRTGAGGRRVAFVHPRSAGGVLVEIREAEGGGATARRLAPGSVVVLYMLEPPAKVWGVLRSLDGTGVTIEGIDLRSFEETLGGILAGEIGPGDISLAFYPLQRVEKVLLDRGTDSAPSLEDQFRARVHISLEEFLSR